MDVRDSRTVHRLPSSISRRLAERRPGSIGHITLRGKCAGARSAGKPHAACDVAGAGNGLTVRLVRHSHRKRGETDRPHLRSTAPALDPTGRPVVSKNTNELKTRLDCNKQVQMAKQPGGHKWPARWPPHGRCPQRPRAGRWRASVPCGRPLRWRAGLPGLPPASSS